MPNINLIAVGLAGLMGMTVGALWYGPIFGKQWMKLMGFTKETINEAKKKGCHEAIMLDEHGFVAEGPGENIFIVKKGIILTPTRSAILQGITRDSVMNIARDRGYKVKERKITVRDLKNAHEAFFTGTAAEITPIRVIDKKEIGNGSAGGVTKELQLAFFAIVKGKNPVYEDWLTFC